MAAVPFIVVNTSNNRIVRCGTCQLEMVDAQAQASSEQGVLVTEEELATAKAQLRAAMPTIPTSPQPDALDVIREILSAKGIDVTNEEIAAATESARVKAAGNG